MKIVTNEKLIKRNSAIGKYSGFISLAILGGGLYISFQKPDLVWLSMTALILGFIISQTSMYYVNRWGRSPRPDEALNAALKGLDDRYTLYHYTTPTPHLLVGPAGVWVLLPYYHTGTIIYDQEKERWRRKGGNLYLRFFAQDTIGRPSKDITFETEAVKKSLSKIPAFEAPPINAALIFTSESAKVEAENAPAPTMHALQLKKFIRKLAKSSESLSMVDVQTIQDSLGN